VFFAPTRTSALATLAPIRAWQVQSSTIARDAGEAISAPDYRASGWLDAPARSTVMAALLANGHFGDVFFSTNLRDDVDPALFRVPWWYRSEFTVSGGGRTLLRTEGVIHKAELWVNGNQVAGTHDIAGAYHVVDENERARSRHLRRIAARTACAEPGQSASRAPLHIPAA